MFRAAEPEIVPERKSAAEEDVKQCEEGKFYFYTLTSPGKEETHVTALQARGEEEKRARIVKNRELKKCQKRVSREAVKKNQYLLLAGVECV